MTVYCRSSRVRGVNEGLFHRDTMLGFFFGLTRKNKLTQKLMYPKTSWLISKHMQNFVWWFLGHGVELDADTSSSWWHGWGGVNQYTWYVLPWNVEQKRAILNNCCLPCLPWSKIVSVSARYGMGCRCWPAPTVGFCRCWFDTYVLFCYYCKLLLNFAWMGRCRLRARPATATSAGCLQDGGSNAKLSAGCGLCCRAPLLETRAQGTQRTIVISSGQMKLEPWPKSS